jgi:hypothetical protein
MEIGTCSTTFAQTRGENEQEKKNSQAHQAIKERANN